MNGYLIFNNIDSRDYGVYLLDFETDNAPERVYDRYEVPARDGDLLVDSKRFENVSHVYKAIIYDNYEENLSNFRNAIKSQVGYKRLEDSFHEGEFYIACCHAPMVITTHRERDMGTFNLEFDRKPQRYLVSGEEKTTLQSSGTIINPTHFEAAPLLRIYGTGTVEFGSCVITVSNVSEYVDVDCFTMEAYKGAVSKNGDVGFSSLTSPKLKAGTNNVTLSGVSKLEVTPRWYKL